MVEKDIERHGYSDYLVTRRELRLLELGLSSRENFDWQTHIYSSQAISSIAGRAKITSIIQTCKISFILEKGVEEVG